MDHKSLMNKAIEIAHKAEKDGNLPVGSVITFRDEILSEGPSRVYQPRYDLTRHSEMEAIRALPVEYWKKSADLIIYTTLEPCMMCVGAILLFGIGKVVYGAGDPYGGGISLETHLPPFFRERYLDVEWIGPLMAKQCDPLRERLLELEAEHKNK
jgi:tRNA(adenine34) deaminase